VAIKQIRSVGIVVKPGNTEALATAGDISTWLSSHNIDLSGGPVVSDSIHGDDFPAMNADLIVVLGGDGTMI